MSSSASQSVAGLPPLRPEFRDLLLQATVWELCCVSKAKTMWDLLNSSLAASLCKKGLNKQCKLQEEEEERCAYINRDTPYELTPGNNSSLSLRLLLRLHWAPDMGNKANGRAQL